MGNMLSNEILCYIENNKEKIFEYLSHINDDEKFYNIVIKEVYLYLKNETDLLDCLDINQLKEIPLIIYTIAKHTFMNSRIIHNENEFLEKIGDVYGFIFFKKCVVQ